MPRPNRDALVAAQIANIYSASDLRERAFGHKVQMDADKLSLAQMRVLQQRANQQELLTLARARFQLSYRNKLSAAAAIEQLSTLDPRSPKYQTTRGEILANFAEGVDNPGVRTILEEQDKTFNAHTEAQKSRAVSTFTGQAKNVWDKTYKQTGDMTFANKMAEAEAANLTRAQKAVTDPNLDPGLRAKLYDPSSGQLSTDPTLLTQADVDIQTKLGAQKQEAEQSKHIKSLDQVLKTLGTASPDESQTAKDIRFNALQALKDYTFNAKNQSAAAVAPAATTDTSAVDNEIASLLGKTPATSTPAPAATTPSTEPADTEVDDTGEEE